MKVYLNTKTPIGVETVDELNSNDYKSYKDFRQEVRRLKEEYSLAFNTPVYTSQRSAKNWSE